MNTGTVVFLCVVAAAAAGTSIAVGSNLSVAVPAAAIAVGATAVLLVGVVEQTRVRAGKAQLAPEIPAAKVRSSFRAGRLGRNDLIELLDSLEWASGEPRPRGASFEERNRLEGLGTDEFREYLDQRISELERRT